jgi:DNA-binding IclR family transcriptional regulator
LTEEERIPTNLRMLLILEVLGRAEQAMTPTEINAVLGLPKQTVHRLCATLETEGFITRAQDGKRLKPARRAVALGAGLLQSGRDHFARHQILEHIADRVNEAVNYVVPQETGMHYLDRVDTNWAFRIQLPVGTNVPFHCTASGKTYMASLPPTARRAFVLGLHLQAHTAKTIISANDLLDELAATRKRGYALDNEEFMDGMVAIAVPVTDPQGRYIAALATHGPAQRLTIEKAIGEKDALLAGAQRLQSILFS